MSEFFGPLVGNWNVEQAVIATYREWMPTWLAAVERANNMPLRSIPRPPTPQHYYGGLDFQTNVPGTLPVVIVVVGPAGPPERRSGPYGQDFAIHVGCVVEGISEEQARMWAGLYGVAAQMLVQAPGLKGIADDLEMSAAPEPQWVDPEEAQRRLIRSVTTFTAHVKAVVDESMAPASETLAQSPEITEPEAPPTERPVASKTHLTIQAEEP